METHLCVGCNCTWTRVPTKGQRPRYCPECRPAKNRTAGAEHPCQKCGTRATRYTICGPCQLEDRVRAGAAASAAKKLAASALRKQLVLVGHASVSDRLHFRRAAARLEQAARGSRAKNVIWVSAACIRCEAPFVCMLTGGLPQYCSRSCSRSDSKIRRRARQYGSHHVTYRRRAIYERDRWICQLCRKRTKRHAKVPDPKAPVIDHIVPLAAGPENGGVDAPWNVQCAHFLCNSFKSATYSAPALF